MSVLLLKGQLSKILQSDEVKMGTGVTNWPTLSSFGLFNISQLSYQRHKSGLRYLVKSTDMEECMLEF